MYRRHRNKDWHTGYLQQRKSQSPDKKYLLVEKIDKPFSYLVTANGFNSTVQITDMNGVSW